MAPVAAAQAGGRPGPPKRAARDSEVYSPARGTSDSAV
ncbi:hypothetical protein SFUMM280S_05005 [Streptomyces fumanus]